MENGDFNGTGTLIPEKRGFRPIYIWSIIYVVMTYIYPVLAVNALPHPDASITSQEQYDEFARQSNGGLGSNLVFVFLLIPLLLAIINIVICATSKNVNRREMLIAARITKYALIPFYIMGGMLIVIFFLLIFTPIVFMIFVSPPAIAFLSVMGWISMAGTAPMLIAFLVKGVKDGAHGKAYAIGMSVTQYFFGLDVVGLIVCAVKERVKK